MKLTPEQQALLDGSKGEVMAKVVKTLVMYGDTFEAERMVPVTSQYGHTVISYGLAALKPVLDLFDQLIDAGLTDGQKFTADPRPLGVTDAASWCLELPQRIGVAAVPFAPFTDRFADDWSHLVRFAFCKQPAVLDEAGRRLQALRG